MRMPGWCRRLLILIILCFASVQVLQVYCPGWVCNTAEDFREKDEAFPALKKRHGKAKVQMQMFNEERYEGVSLWDDEEARLRRDVKFSLNASDVLVFLHIQKTGGTVFGKNMVKNLFDPSTGRNVCSCKPESKRCKCYRPGESSQEWLFSRFSTGWKCGLHADYTELIHCVDQVMAQKDARNLPPRRYFYMTLLRHPYRRFLSEFLHVQRGATWKNSRHWCGGRFASEAELRQCFHGDTWEGVSLDGFLACPDNLAVNRLTRMLADLREVGCYNNSVMSIEDHDRLMLTSAKANLRKMAFFGIIERIDDTQTLFEATFGLRFAQRLNNSYEPRGENFTMSDSQRTTFMKQIALDVQLFEYAKSLFQQRVQAVKRYYTTTQNLL